MPQMNIFEVLRGPGVVQIGTQRPLGPFLERLGLMEASWSNLGGLLGCSWSALGRLRGLNKQVGNGSWPANEHIQDRFHLCEGVFQRAACLLFGGRMSKVERVQLNERSFQQRPRHALDRGLGIDDTFVRHAMFIPLKN